MERSDKYFISVVIPVYNQKYQLSVTLHWFEMQSYPHNDFEVIVINDGSNDISDEDYEYWRNSVSFSITFINIIHSGSAAARNVGVEKARGDYLIFCDADRFPDESYISNYVKTIQEYKDQGRFAFIGCIKDFFGKHNDIHSDKEIKRYSRTSQYYKKITAMYMGQESTNSGIAWATFLIGNLCMSKKDFIEIGMLDENFKEWGFEHFDLGFRFVNDGAKLINCYNSVNYHIPHSRGREFYKNAIANSIDYLSSKYPEIGGKFNFFREFMLGNISLQEFEKRFSNTDKSLPDNQKEIYFKL